MNVVGAVFHAPKAQGMTRFLSEYSTHIKQVTLQNRSKGSWRNDSGLSRSSLKTNTLRSAWGLFITARTLCAAVRGTAAGLAGTADDFAGGEFEDLVSEPPLDRGSAEADCLVTGALGAE